jgi:hypothetical protein
VNLKESYERQAFEGGLFGETGVGGDEWRLPRPIFQRFIHA